MANNVGNVVASLDLDTRRASQSFRRFEKEVQRASKNLNGLGSITQDARQFEAALGAATNRVTAFAAAAVVFNTISSAVSSFVSSVFEVDEALTKINVNLNQSTEGLKNFSRDLFNVARETGQTFDVTAKAAEELARQGLSAEETTKRLKDALMLSRIAGIDSADAVETLTAAINSFNQSALTSSEVVNKFAAVDTKFAVSSKDLSEAISRVGSTAQAAGLDINQLIGLVTSLQQTTALGGANIGNGLKTIFTRITAAPETISALQSVGVAVKDSNGNLRSGIQILQDYVKAREGLTEAEQSGLDRIVAGTFQINKLKAALSDVSKEYGFYAGATRTAANATSEAIQKNAQLNQTLQSLLTQTSLTFKELFASIGNQSLSPFLRGIFDLIESTRNLLSGKEASQLGKDFGDGLLRGITSVITGPILIGVAAVLFNAFRKVFSTILQDAQVLLKINKDSEARARIQERINFLMSQTTEQERAQLALTRGNVAAQAQILRLVQARVAAQEVLGSPLQNALLTRNFYGKASAKGFRTAEVPNFADPVASAISREIQSGVSPSAIYVDRDSRVSSPSNPAGLLVANTRDEPLGGYQGVNRVVSQGRNPKTSGSVPNFALTGRDLPFIPKRLLKEINKILDTAESQTNKTQFFSEISKATDVALSGKLKPASANRLQREVNKIIEERTALEKQIEEGRLRNAQRSKSFADQEARLIPLREKLNKEAARVLAKRAQEQSFQRAYYGPKTSPAPENFIETGSGVRGQDDPYVEEFLRKNRGANAYKNPIGPSYRQFENYQDAQFRGRYKRLAKAMTGSAYRMEYLEKRNKATAERALAQQKKDRIASRTQFASIPLSLAAGFIPEGESGTTSGMLYGAARGAATGGSFGAMTGRPDVALAGALIGAAINGFSKLSKSSEELNAEIEEGIAIRGKERDSLSQYLRIEEDLAEAKKNNLDKSTIDKLEDNRKTALRSLSANALNIVSESNPKIRSNKYEEFMKNSELIDARDNIRKQLNSGKALSVDIFKQAIPNDLDKFITESQIKTLAGAARTNFAIPSLVSAADDGQGNAAEFIAAQKKYKESLEELTPVLKYFVDVASLTPETLSSISEKVLGAITQIKNAEKKIVNNSTQEPILPTLSRGAFTELPNTALFNEQGRRSRFSQFSKGKSAREKYSTMKELISAGDNGLGEQIKRDPEFKKIESLTQLTNVQDLSTSYLRGLGIGGNFGNSARGFNQAAIKGALGYRKDKDIIAKYALEALERAENTAIENKAIQKSGYAYTTTAGRWDTAKNKVDKNSVKLSTSSDNAFNADFNARLAAARERDSNRKYTLRGINSLERERTDNLPIVRTRDIIKELDSQPTDNLPVVKTNTQEKALEIQIKIDGALNLIEKGQNPQLVALMQSAVTEAAKNAAQEYVTQYVNPGLEKLNMRVSKIEGSPTPPAQVK